MIIIGEKINATRSEVAEALDARDADTIRRLATEQVEAGATYIDVNAGHPTEEQERMAWLIDTVQGATDLPLSIDSSDPAVVRDALTRVDSKPLVNSISLEAERLESLLEVVAGADCAVVALLMSDEGVPAGVEDRLARAETLASTLTEKAGKALGDLFVDPCFMAIYTDPNAGGSVLESIAAIRAKWPEIHITGGLSNTSHGLPKRKWINLAYLVAAMARGLDAAIADPCVRPTMPLVLAAEAVLGRDPMAMAYVTAEREGKL